MIYKYVGMGDQEQLCEIIKKKRKKENSEWKNIDYVSRRNSETEPLAVKSFRPFMVNKSL